MTTTRLEDVTDLMVVCANCDYDLAIINNTGIPFTGYFNVVCPNCGMILTEREHFDFYKFVADDR